MTEVLTDIHFAMSVFGFIKIEFILLFLKWPGKILSPSLNYILNFCTLC